eukprot:scaffold23406_cov105-Isochrysis_galbana.AAC.2
MGREKRKRQCAGLCGVLLLRARPRPGPPLPHQAPAVGIPEFGNPIGHGQLQKKTGSCGARRRAGL